MPRSSSASLSPTRRIRCAHRVRHKPGQPIEFGRKVLLDAVDGGIVSRYEVLAAGGGQDHRYLKASLDGHRRRLGKPPDLWAGDRGFYTAANERLAEEAGG